MENINEREIALFALHDIIEENGYNNIVLRRTLNRYGILKPNQKAFITEIVNGTLRNLIHIDYIISLYSKTPITKMKPLILNILRISVYQIKFMDKVPVSAVCNEAVNLSKKNGLSGLSGFVNGVLRNIVRNLALIPYLDQLKEPEKYIEVQYSVPLWIVQYWKSFLGIQQTEELCKAFLLAPEITACVNLLKTDRQELTRLLETEGLSVSPGSLKNAVRLKNISDLRQSGAFKEGLFHIMDESSMRAVEILNPQKGDKVFDLCAAPGGKSFYAAYLMENQGEIISGDIHAHKIALINETAQRLGIDIIQTVVKDASVYQSDMGQADCVLLDAPCSGLGLIRRKPDIKYTKNYEHILALAQIQKQMLENASKYVKKGGRLLYSTCTISNKENEDNVQWFLENFDFEPVTINENDQGYFYQLPNIHGTDGFFVSLFRRKD